MSQPTPLTRKILIATTALVCLSGCNMFERLEEVGSAPKMASIQDPTQIAGKEPVKMPMPAPNMSERQANSLWKTGSRAFFRDQRATRVGDILTVVIDIDEKAEWSNTTERKRTSTEKDSMTNMFGFETMMKKYLPDAVDPTALVNSSTATDNKGDGSIDRSEKITLKVAATIVQVLPNGNLVLAGKQQISVNFDLRELMVTGVIRPEDISSDNTIAYDKIAEARISYGGKGSIQEIQQPRYGTQVLDVVMPF